MTDSRLKIGDVSANGQIKIVDEDRLCYIVESSTRGAYGIRTISKKLLQEYIEYFISNPEASASDARNALCGTSSIDKFEYGYTATLSTMAKMAIDSLNVVENISCIPSCKTSILQQIFYGAPGTGKSRTIKDETIDEDVVRTTFHPDSDYSTFVGAYKPTTALLPICDELGQPMNIGNTILHKEQIVYKFVPQAFLQAYVEAWKKFATAEREPQKQYLVIEEINRGNCAQIFGDLFQLLDRNDDGFSDYPIKADTDMQRELKKQLDGLVLKQKEVINTMFNGRNIADEVLNGNVLLLPNNLYIWATMNTSDQSLFPIDSAFKRRWDWTYMPISDGGKGWMIEAAGKKYDWWQFLTAINEKIGSTTSSEDKKLGYYFCKANGENIISAERFVGKVLFYLWNDVFKDYEFSDFIFDDADGKKLTFDKFYTEAGRNSKVVEEKVSIFLDNLGLKPITIEQEEENMGSAEKQDLTTLG